MISLKSEKKQINVKMFQFQEQQLHRKLFPPSGHANIIQGVAETRKDI